MYHTNYNINKKNNIFNLKQIDSLKLQYSMLCSHYNRSEHDPDSYFQLIGYPEWWGERARGGSTKRFSKTSGSPNA